MGQNIVPDQKAKSAADHQRHQHDVQKRLSGYGGQRCARTQQVEPCVAESGHRMKDRHPDAPQPVAGTKPEQQQQSTHSLAHCRHRQDPPGQPDDAAHLQSAHRIHQHCPTVQADPPSQQHGDEDGHGHKAQTAHLDQKQDHSLSEESELRPGVIEHQSGHAGSRRGGKYRIQKRQ